MIKSVDLQTPATVSIFDDDEGLVKVATGTYKKQLSKDYSKFACSETFRVFSDEGAKHIGKIGKELKVKTYYPKNELILPSSTLVGLLIFSLSLIGRYV